MGTAKCGWCVTGTHTDCKPWVFYEGRFWFCDCTCKTQEERDGIQRSDDVRSRLEKWETQESRLGDKRKRRTKRGVSGGKPEGAAPSGVPASKPARADRRRSVRSSGSPIDFLLLEAVRGTQG